MLKLNTRIKFIELSVVMVFLSIVTQPHKMRTFYVFSKHPKGLNHSQAWAIGLVPVAAVNKVGETLTKCLTTRKKTH